MLRTALVLCVAAACGCAGGGVASELAKPPEFNPKGQAKCRVKKSLAKPLIVEWPSAERVDLEAGRQQGPVVVRYDGCEMQLLTQCRAPGDYTYQAVALKRDTIVIKDADELYTHIPMGAARFEAKLAKSGQLNVAMTMVGRWMADRPQVRQDQLEGVCAGATHILGSLTVGAFEFFAGADAEVGASADFMRAGGGARSAAKRETLTEDGNPQACRAEQTDAPPIGCSALLRVEAVPLLDSPAPRVACPEGTTYDGKVCVRTEVVTKTKCPSGSRWNGSECVRDAHCPTGTQWDGSKCVSPSKRPICPRGTTWDGKRCATQPQADKATTSENWYVYLPAFRKMRRIPASAPDKKGCRPSASHCEARCNAGDAFACWTGAFMLQHGRMGVPRDGARAAELIRKGCNIDAQNCAAMKGQ